MPLNDFLYVRFGKNRIPPVIPARPNPVLFNPVINCQTVDFDPLGKLCKIILLRGHTGSSNILSGRISFQRAGFKVFYTVLYRFGGGRGYVVPCHDVRGHSLNDPAEKIHALAVRLPSFLDARLGVTGGSHILFHFFPALKFLMRTQF